MQAQTIQTIRTIADVVFWAIFYISVSGPLSYFAFLHAINFFSDHKNVFESDSEDKARSIASNALQILNALTAEPALTFRPFGFVMLPGALFLIAITYCHFIVIVTRNKLTPRRTPKDFR